MDFLHGVHCELIRSAILCRAYIQSRLYRHRFFLLGTPIHGNLGDHAIALADRTFLKDHFPQ